MWKDLFANYFSCFTSICFISIFSKFQLFFTTMIQNILRRQVGNKEKQIIEKTETIISFPSWSLFMTGAVLFDLVDPTVGVVSVKRKWY